MTEGEAAGWLDRVHTLRRRVRRVRRRTWLPVLLLGVLVLGSTPLYAATPAPSSPPGTVTAGATIEQLPRYFPTGAQVADPWALALYWLVGTVVALGLSAWLYRWHGSRRGVAGPIAGYPIAGLCLLAVLVLAAVAFGPVLGGDLGVRGMLPLFAVTAALAALAWLERNLALAVFTALVAALSLVANLYDLENVTMRLGLGWNQPAVNVVAVGALLLAGSALFGLRGRREHGASGAGIPR